MLKNGSCVCGGVDKLKSRQAVKKEDGSNKKNEKMKKRRKAFLCNLSLLTVMLTFSRVLAFTLVFEVK